MSIVLYSGMAGTTLMPDAQDLYEADFVRWSEDQASALRSAGSSGANLPLDWEHLAEEIDSLGKSLRSELRNRCATIIEHLLKLSISPADGPRSGWIGTIERERVDVELLLRDNPSLRTGLSATIDDALAKAKRVASINLREHDEWTPEVPSLLKVAEFGIEEVLGPWLPPAGARDT